MIRLLGAIALAAFGTQGALAQTNKPKPVTVASKPASTKPQTGASFASFLQSLWPLAQAEGVSRETFDEAFEGLTVDASIVALTKKQSEFSKPIWSYVAGAVSSGIKGPLGPVSKLVVSTVGSAKYFARSASASNGTAARNAEAGAYWTASAGELRWEARAIGYYNRIDDLIVFQCDASFNCMPQNVSRALLPGVTLGVDATWRATQVKASLDLQHPHDEDTGNLLPRRARTHGAVQLLQQVGPVQLGMEYVASSLRYDDAANLVRMGGYGIVNLTADWPFAPGWSLLVRGNNVFAKNYQLAADFSTGGAQVFAGVRWQP